MPTASKIKTEPRPLAPDDLRDLVHAVLHHGAATVTEVHTQVDIRCRRRRGVEPPTRAQVMAALSALVREGRAVRTVGTQHRRKAAVYARDVVELEGEVRS